MKIARIALACILAVAWTTPLQKSHACCPVAGRDQHVVNADQSVIMVWDKQSGTQHFIRKADFKTDAPDVGFIVPSPSRPQLDESGDHAFDLLSEITAPKREPRGMIIPIGCAAPPPAEYAQRVQVIEEKRVAGFDATVLTARSGTDLVEWLQQNGYPYSPAVAEWAKPYLGGNWHFTALKVAKEHDRQLAKELKAAALRISFQTTRPLFPYREPDSGASSTALKIHHRLLRIHFIADTQYEGRINGKPWSGRTTWSGDITAHRKDLLQALQLPATTGPKTWWLTEINDLWPYEKAEGDVYFRPVEHPHTIDRDGTNRPVQLDVSLLAALLLAGAARLRRR